ncbi:MAG TPA: dTDP-4-dehydrorhamnose 3,5-epimerase [Clostridium sp.]|nr:dTDP-4-dehydrorhamnose 3,5-epimerase [Clostridium sp.]
MEVIDTEIKGVKLIKLNKVNDNRGLFCKTYNEKMFEDMGIKTKIKESYYSISNKDVIRGMHFQIEPYAHDKIVYVTKGKILDVVLDIRKDSPTYKKYFSIELTHENSLMLYIPKGCAHGFKSLEDNTMVMYNVSSVYSPKHDKGIHYNSFGMNWGIKNPIVSERDKGFFGLDEMDL